MIEGQDILCFANDWDGDPLSKKHIMTRLARRNRVLWINSIGCRTPRASGRDLARAWRKVGDAARGCREVADNIWVLPPLAIPFHGHAAARFVNRHWLRASLGHACRKLKLKDPITWSFLPSSAGVAGALHERLLVYHCVDEFSCFTGTDAAAIDAMEAELLRRADVVLVSSQPLRESKRAFNERTYFVSHGVDVDHFGKALDAATEVPADLPRGERVVGFYGLVADWVDLDLVAELARRRPAWTFVLIGKVDTGISVLDGLPNVRLLGRKDYADLPRYCKGFDAAILPFRINTLTRAANPLKLREYLAAGLPVVASAIPEVERLAPHVRVAHGPASFLDHLEEALSDGERGPRAERARAMERESWDAKVDEMCALVESSLQRGRPS